MQFQTRCVHTGVDKDSQFPGVITPIYQTSTFYFDDVEARQPYDYTRSGNPTRTALEENLASLEGGTQCRATSTGMSAITAIMHLFQAGDHIIVGHDTYGGTFRLFNNVYAARGFEFSFVEMGDAENIRRERRPNTKAIWIETPSNPLLRVYDIAAIVEVARESGAITIADNTFLSPYLQRPLELGVDIVMHSTTKYLNGHSDVVGGCVITRHKEHSEQIAYLVNTGRGVLAVRCVAGPARYQDAWPADGGPSARRDSSGRCWRLTRKSRPSTIRDCRRIALHARHEAGQTAAADSRDAELRSEG
ncbi:MAG: PLP-dependent aspartate aminotransferase family protein [Planctomycetaceae bacterium]